MSSNTSAVVVGLAQKQRHQGRQQIRFFGTGARGARGLGWYQKYREGRGGRHLQGPQFDRESRDVLAEMNDTIFRMGSMWYTIRLCEMASSTSSNTSSDSDASMTTGATTSDTDEFTNEANTNDNPLTFHDLHLELATAAMPLTTTNFALLGPQYKNTIVHRIEKKVGLCLGDVKMNLGRSGYCHESLSSTGKLPTTEPLVLSHLAGVVTMVSSGVDKVDSRFMLCTADAYQLDGRFVAFGRLSPASLAICQEIEKSHYTTRGLPNVEIKVVSCEPLVENTSSAVSEVSDDQSA
jgi:cyclophilin family peptidyl-prolyl cis-trans isomerase